MSTRINHIQHISKSPAIACTGASTTAFLPCLLDIFSGVVGSFIAALGPLADTLGTLGSSVSTGFGTIILGIRNLPWKVT